MRLLISAFEPFGGRRRNTSAELLRKIRLRRLLDGEKIQFRKLLLPVHFDTAWPRLSATLAHFKPDLVILSGEGKAAPVTLETAARNQRRAEALTEEIDPILPPHLRSSAAEKLATLLEKAGGISIEHDPGDYLCNYSYFRCLSQYPRIPTIFLHVKPLYEADSAEFELSKSLVERAILLAARIFSEPN